MVPLIPAAILSLVGLAFASSSHSSQHNDQVSKYNAECACDHLMSSYPSLTIAPGATNYTMESTRFWDRRSNMQPSCIFLPTTANEVSRAIGILHKCNNEFAIRGGGHMNFPGSNNINGGVLIGLNGLNKLKVSKSEQSIEVGPGNTWSDVYNALGPYGRYAIGGRLKTIGVPGLTLIGGVGYFLNKYGFSMDNVLSYDVVLGNGTQVKASSDCNSDLFWALKGGAGNFGVVTKFVFKTYNVPKVSSTFQVFDESTVQAFIEAACDMVLSEDGSIGAGAVVNINYNVTTREVTPQVFGLQEGVESPPSRFASFTKIPAVRRIHNVTEPVVWHAQFDTPNQMFRIQFGHHTIKPDAEQLYHIYHLWRTAIEEVAHVEGIFPTFVLNLVPKTAARVAKSNGIGNAFGLEEESYIWFQFATSWAREEDDLRMSTWTQSLLSHCHELNRQLGLATEFLYMGDAAEFQKPFEAYGDGNLKKLREIREIYDPDLVFTHLNWGGFKIGE